jgi:hypothetical protein
MIFVNVALPPPHNANSIINLISITTLLVTGVQPSELGISAVCPANKDGGQVSL